MSGRAMFKGRGRRFPLWVIAAMAAGVIGVVAAGGQALGPVLAGNTGGNVGVVASQDLVFTSAVATKGHAGDLDQAVGVVDTSGLIVTAAFRGHRGDPPSNLTLNIENFSNNRRAAQLLVHHPAGLGVDVYSLFAFPGVIVAQQGVELSQDGTQTDTYLLTVDPDTNGDFFVDIVVGTADPLGTHDIVFELLETP